MSDKFEALKKKYPDLNWKEAEEVFEEDLDAAADLYDNLLKKVGKDGTKIS